jgi:hypothetical protein
MGDDDAHLILRDLDAADYAKGFPQLLGQLSVVGDLPEDVFQGKRS